MDMTHHSLSLKRTGWRSVTGHSAWMRTQCQVNHHAVRLRYTSHVYQMWTRSTSDTEKTHTWCGKVSPKHRLGVSEINSQQAPSAATTGGGTPHGE